MVVWFPSRGARLYANDPASSSALGKRPSVSNTVGISPLDTSMVSPVKQGSTIPVAGEAWLCGKRRLPRYQQASLPAAPLADFTPVEVSVKLPQTSFTWSIFGMATAS